MTSRSGWPTNSHVIKYLANNLRSQIVTSSLLGLIFRLENLARLLLFQLFLNQQLSQLRNNFPRDLADDFV